MKTKIIKGGQKEILLVQYEKEEVRIEPIENTRFNTLEIDLPEGCEGFTFLNTLQNLEEGQCVELVKSRYTGGGLMSFPRQLCFKDYVNGGFPRGLTARWSLKRLLESHGVLLENPYKEFSLLNTEKAMETYLLWEHAEKNVFIPERTLVFVKE